MKALLASALALSASAPLLAKGASEPSPAEAACDEQMGEFRRDGFSVYCDIGGVLFEGTEQPQARPAPAPSFDVQRDRRDARRESTQRADPQTEILNQRPK